MAHAKATITILSPSELRMGDEVLPYLTHSLPVVRNRKSGRLGIHARRGGGGYFYMRPLRKDGTLEQITGTGHLLLLAAVEGGDRRAV